MTPADVIARIQQEFGPLGPLFHYRIFHLDNLAGEEFNAARKPGVYVFLNELGCIKVGKHERNAPKRAMEHCGPDNTTSADGTIQMQSLVGDAATQLLIINLATPIRQMHWLLALERFLEDTLSPAIRSKRTG